MAHYGSFWLSLAHPGFLWLKLALSVALSGSLCGSLWLLVALSLSLSGSLWLFMTPTFAPTGSDCHSLAYSGPLRLTNINYIDHDGISHWSESVNLGSFGVEGVAD